MLVYFACFILTLILNALIKARTPLEYKRKLCIILTPLFLFGALRVSGGDFQTYQDTFNLIHKARFTSEISGHFEWGFVALCKALPTFRSLVVLVSLLMCLGFGSLFYRLVPPKYLWIAIVLLFLSAGNSVYFILQTMRNGIAVSLLMLAFPMIRAKRFIWYLALGIIAWSIHTSAIFAFTVAFIAGSFKKNFTQREMVMWISVISVFFIFSATEMLDFIAPYVNEYFDRYDAVIREISKVGDRSAILLTIGALTITVPVLIFLKNTKLTQEQNQLFRLFLLYCLSFFMGIFNLRVTQYFCPYMICAIPIMYYKIPQRIWGQIYFWFVVCFISYAFYLWTQGITFIHHAQYHSILN